MIEKKKTKHREEYKRKRRIKYPLVLWTWLLILFVIILLSFLIYKMEWDRQEDILDERISDVEDYIQDAVSMCIDPFTGEPADELNADDLLYHVANVWLGNDNFLFRRQNPGDWESSKYGLAMEVYDKDNNLLIQSGTRNLIIRWKNLETDQVELWALEQYFDEDQIKELLDFFYTAKQEMSVSLTNNYIDGYYEGERFVPVAIEFDVDDLGERIDIVEHSTYTLVNKEKKAAALEKGLVTRVIVNPTKNEEVYYPVPDSNIEYGYTLWEMFNTCQNVSKKTWKIFDENFSGVESLKKFGQAENTFSSYDGESVHIGKGILGTYPIYGKYMEGIILADDDLYFALTVCGDLKTITLQSHYFWKYIQMMIQICVCIGVILSVVSIIFQKKKNDHDDMRETFINAMAHEMKTPAAVIKNSVECIRANICPDKNGHYLEMIEQEAEHMNALLGNMLVYTRTKDAVCQLYKEDCFLEELAENAYSHFQYMAEQKGLQIIWEKRDMHRVSCDKNLIGMVLDNFISNAIKYTASGGMVRICLERKEIRIYNETEHIPEERLERIWEPMYREDAARTYSYGSGGMGLAVCKNILELHKAKYGVHNKEGGIEFYFSLLFLDI